MRILKNRKKLNNKGFTLIELLAVVVILAVVMGIAMTSVLSSMNKARGGSLSDSATSIAQAMQTKYTESLVDGAPSAVYNDVGSFAGYDFTNNYVNYLDSQLATEFNITSTAYSLTSVVTSGFSTTGIDKSIIGFNATTGKFVVCMVANPAGSYYVAAYSIGNSANKSTVSKVSINGSDYTFKNGEMFACSDGTKSW